MSIPYTIGQYNETVIHCESAVEAVDFPELDFSNNWLSYSLEASIQDQTIIFKENLIIGKIIFNKEEIELLVNLADQLDERKNQYLKITQ